MSYPIDYKKVQAVIFDLGRVLVKVDFTRGLFKYYKRDQNSTDTEVLEKLFKDQIFIDFNTGKISPQQVYRKLVAKYQLHLDFEQFVYEWCDIFESMEGMAELVQRVSQKYKIGLLSDIDPLHWAYCINNFEFLKVFTRPALSYQIGALKPDLLCYQTAAAYSSVSPEHCLFIDDREINVNGAIGAGMQALQFTGIEKLKIQIDELLL